MGLFSGLTKTFKKAAGTTLPGAATSFIPGAGGFFGEEGSRGQNIFSGGGPFSGAAGRPGDQSTQSAIPMITGYSPDLPTSMPTLQSLNPVDFLSGTAQNPYAAFNILEQRRSQLPGAQSRFITYTPQETQQQNNQRPSAIPMSNTR